MTKLKAFLAFVSFFFKFLPKALIYWVGKQRGRDEEELRRLKRDYDLAKIAWRARRNTKHDANHVSKDPYNRDNS